MSAEISQSAIAAHESANAASIAYRLQNSGLMIDSVVPFDIRKYPYLIELFDVNCRRKTIIKGAQMGFTVFAVLRAIMECQLYKLRGILYLFPTVKAVEEFSAVRFAPMMANRAFQDLLSKDVDRASVKKIAGRPIYFRAAGAKGASTKQSLDNVKSIPVDRIFYDERDEMQDQRVDAAHHRLDGILDGEETMLSTPTIPNYGVDFDYQQSDQRIWMWRCHRCTDWFSMELSYPDCIADPDDGDAFYICPKCREPVTLLDCLGEWVPQKLDVKNHMGYYVSQLCSPTRTAQNIIDELEQSERTGRKQEFFNQVLAQAWAPIEDQLNRAILDECIGSEPRALRSQGPCIMGVDPGVREHHYWIKTRISEDVTRTLTYGSATSPEELDRICKKFHVDIGIMDAGAESHLVWNFVRDHANWWGCRYVDTPKSAPDWHHKDRLVVVNRTDCLDASHNKFLSGREILPTPNPVYNDLVVPHLTNLARVKFVDDTSGQVKYRWVVTGGVKRDHLKHAHSLATLGEDRVGLNKSDNTARTDAKKKSKARKRKRRSWMSR